MKEKYSVSGENGDAPVVNDIDGVKIEFKDKWVHLRPSNTEPIIRVYSEAHTMQEAEDLAQMIIKEIVS